MNGAFWARMSRHNWRGALRRNARPQLGRGTTLDLLVGGVVLVVCAAVQLAFLLGPYPFDSAKYFRTAVDFTTVSPDLWTLRIGVTIPVRVAVLLFGPSEAALYAVPIVVALVLAAAVYGTMVLLFRDRLLAALAALVTVLNTNWLLKSSSIFADTIATATFTAGFFFLVAGARRSVEGGDFGARIVFPACAGILFGWTYLARESSLILVPAVVAGVLFLRYPLRRVAVLAAATIATAGIEILYGFIRYDEPFIHVRILRAERYRERQTEEEVVEHIQGQVDGLLEAIVVSPRLLLSWRTGPILLLLVGVFLVALGARFKDKRLWLLASWFFGFWIALAMLGRGSLPSGGWIVNVAIIRYWLPIFPPLIMGAFGGLALLIPKRFRIPGGIALVHAIAAVLAFLAVVPGLVEFKRCEARNVWLNDRAERWHELRSWFATPEADEFDVIWTDGDTYRLVPAFTRSRFGDPLWKGTVKILARRQGRVIPPPGLPNALLLAHRGRSRNVTQSAVVRREWSPVFVSEDGGMLLLAHASTPVGGGRTKEPWWRLFRPLQESWEPGTCGRPYLRKGEPH